MRRAIKVLSVAAAAAAMVWASPVLASCPFQIPMLQGGDTGLPAGTLLATGPDVNGAFWELGFGDPADGAGNDSNSLISGFPAFSQADPNLRWIKPGGAGYEVDYNWFNAGVDNCISGGAGEIVSTVYVHYMTDSAGDYAIAALQGTPNPIPSVNLDLLVGGVGPNGNDVPFAAPVVAPQVVNVTIVDDFSIIGDVLPAEAGVNLYYDAGGPYAGVVDTSALVLNLPGCPQDTGCAGVSIPRDANLCWTGDTNAVGSATPGAAVCVGGVLDGFACDPANPADACLAFTGVCEAGPPVVVPYGPAIPGGCVFIGGPTVNDNATARATKSKGFTVFQITATEFAVSHYNILDVTRGERRINSAPIQRISNNDGSTVNYEFVATGKEIRGGKRFELEMVRTDGQTIRFPVE